MMTNQSQLLKFFATLSISIALLTISSCATKKDDAKTDDGAPNSENVDVNLTGDSDTGKAGGLQTVFFPYDAFTLDGKGKETLKANAKILKDKPSLAVQVEGHCDSRGGIQYNIALGEKRANAVKKFLMDEGIKSDRVTTISFGKERPLDARETEEAYAKNRRGNFVITSK
jgi:peptidoglycan-associated lipoprotein